MKLHPRVTRTAVELVKRFEGLRRKAARLPDGSWTIGYGHTRTAREAAEVSEEEAELLLYYDLSEVAGRVEAWTFTPLNQNQFEALTAFAFNIGTENFRRSTVLKRVNEGQVLQAAAAMELWRKTDVDGEDVVVDALVRRRAAEKAHFLTPPEGFKPSPSQIVRPAFDFSVIEAAAQSHAAARAAEVDVPLDGDETVAHVDRGPPETAVAASESTLATEPAPPPEPETQPANDVANFVPERVADLVLHAPEEQPEPELAVVREPEPETEVDSLAVPPAPDAPPTSTFGFRGFEPPPPRFEQQNDPPTPANQSFLLPEPAKPAERPSWRYEPAAGESLFEQPVAAPLPPVSEMPLERVIRSMPPSEERAERRSRSRSGDEEGAPSILKNAPVLYGSVGCLGVALFALTITSMLTGKPSVAHLLVGLVGVVLMTFAGIYFLLKRWGAAAPANLEELPLRSDQPTE